MIYTHICTYDMIIYADIYIYTYPYTSRWLNQIGSLAPCIRSNASKLIHDTFTYIQKYINADKYTYQPKYIHTDRHVQYIQIFMYIMQLYLHKYMYTCLYISSNHTCKSPYISCTKAPTIYVCIHAHVCRHVWVCTCGCVCVSVYVWVCMCVHTRRERWGKGV